MRKTDIISITLFILIVLVAVTLFPIVAERENQERPHPYTSQSNGRGGEKKKNLYYAQGEEDIKLTTFDPNTADSTLLLGLGLKPWQVRNIYKYRAKGGRYYTKEDFARLYGLTLRQYRQLEPYIHITPEVMASDVVKRKDRTGGYGNGTISGTLGTSSGTLGTSGTPSGTSSGTPSGTSSGTLGTSSGTSSGTVSKLRWGETVDINVADTNELKRIPGIGSYFARKIVQLRERKQCFEKADELLVIREFPEMALDYMTVSFNFPKVRINNSTLQQLKAHPLINHTQASDIIKYCRIKGKIHSITDMSFMPSFTKDQLNRLAPFLNFE